MAEVKERLDHWGQEVANQPEDTEGQLPPPKNQPEPSIEHVEVLPDDLLLGCLRDGRLQVHSPIAVKFTREHQQFVAEAEEFNEFGFGQTWSEALIDLQRAFAELYFTLEEDQARLGSDLHGTWAALQQKIRRRR